MAKPNLTSIFTSSNQYSVLKLLKALCDAVDNIDYADNTEFTNFKEQVNTAINSLEQSIMNNENAISDLNTVTGNNSTEINSIKSQISGINSDSNGNVSVGKNLEVGGTTKFNGGLEPIHTYKIDGVTTLYVYFEYMKYGEFIGYGWIIHTGTVRPCIFHYALQDGKVIRFSGLSDDIIYEYNSNSNLTKTFTIANTSECQSKLYRHRLRLNNLYILMYDSTSNLNVGTVDDLRTIMKISSNSDSQVLPVCTEDSTAMAPLAVTIHYCKVDGVDVTTVSDTVTPL